MRWHYLVAATCFGIISMFRWTDDKPYWAMLFIAICVYYLWRFFNASAGRRPRSVSSFRDGKKDSGSFMKVVKPKKDELEEYIQRNCKSARNWLILALIAVISCVFGLIFVPPFGLVMGAIGIYCVLRYRATRKLVQKADLVLKNSSYSSH